MRDAGVPQCSLWSVSGRSCAPCSSGRQPSPSRISPSPPTRGASALCPPTPARSLGPDPLGLAVPPLDGVALQSRHRSACDRPRLAPPRLSALLAMAIQGERGRPPEARRPASPLDPTHGPREPHLGPPTHPGGTRPPRLPCRRAHCRQVHAPSVTSALAHVARLSHCTPPRARRDRLLRGPHPRLSPALRVRRPPPRPP
jgi:hypothetical protein